MFPTLVRKKVKEFSTDPDKIKFIVASHEEINVKTLCLILLSKSNRPSPIKPTNNKTKAIPEIFSLVNEINKTKEINIIIFADG